MAVDQHENFGLRVARGGLDEQAQDENLLMGMCATGAARTHARQKLSAGLVTLLLEAAFVSALMGKGSCVDGSVLFPLAYVSLTCQGLLSARRNFSSKRHRIESQSEMTVRATPCEKDAALLR